MKDDQEGTTIITKTVRGDSTEDQTTSDLKNPDQTRADRQAEILCPTTTEKTRPTTRTAPSVQKRLI